MDDNMMDRARSGDGEAFAALFSEIQDELYRIAYLYVKNGEDARDVVQETAYRCFRGIKTLRQPEYFKTWVVKTAMNCALNMIRRNKRTVFFEDLPFSQETTSSPEEAALASVTLKRLLNVLDEKEKSVIILKYLYDMSFGDIAKALHMPLGTVKTILYRAIKKMREEDSK